MKLSTAEYISLGFIIVYVAFFTHPTPLFVSQVFSNPLGHVGALVVILLVACRSQIVALFVAIAYLLSTAPSFEYFEDKEQPASSMIPKVDKDMKGAMGKLLGLVGKNVMPPAVAGKSETKKPETTGTVKPTESDKEYTPVK